MNPTKNVIKPKAGKVQAQDKRKKHKAAATKRKSDLTPAMRQYVEQKAQVGDALLLFRMGDFYETFYDDAKIIARVLGLTLTARNKNSEDPIPLAGVPYHSVEGYIAKLVRAGFKVAISEQTEDPKQAKGVVKREVKRVITPGTLTDETLLDERSPNHLVALCSETGDWTQGQVGLACVELASGRFFAERMPATAVADDLARIRPAELLVPDAEIDVDSSPLEALREAIGVAISPRSADIFDPHLAEQRLCRHFGVKSLNGFGFDVFDSSLCAAAAVLEYLQETQKSALAHVLKIVPRRSERCVMIDHVTLRSLEVERTIRDGTREGSLLGAIDLTVNPMGARRLREWVCFPLLDTTEILRRQNAVTDLRHQPDRLRKLREHLREIGDVERIVARLGVGRASPRDMMGLGRALLRCGELTNVIGPSVSKESDLLTQLSADLDGLEPLGTFLTSALKEDAPPVLRDGGFIADGYHEALDRLRNIEVDGRHWLAEYQAREAKRTEIPNLKVGYNSVFGYYIEITHQHRDKVPPEYVRKQTVRNAERYITEELKHHENEVLGAADRAKQLEFELFDEIRERATAELPKLQTAADSIATLDVLGGLAELSRQRDYCRPELIETDGEAGEPGGTLEIVDGRHPVLDVTLAERFVPNDCHLAPDHDQLLVITGPNMAGKSTYIRQVALLVLLAHTGSYVPAKSMRWSPVDRIFARVGASDELARGHSTFMVEMVETTRILHNASSRSLVILDEIGRGTSTYDGLSLAWAITEYMADRIGCRTMFATHYHELTELEDQLETVANYNVAVREQLLPNSTGRDVVFLHKIVPGATDRSYGVHVAAMAGMPASVLKRSEAILDGLEQSFRRQSEKAKLAASAGEDSDQLMLFDDTATMPDWWRELVDTLGEVDVNKTTPIEALSILQTLKGLLHKNS
ncbi:MAG: DNA mismatch repair protein MutS [Phycisphaerales bacterium]|nr:DNA mismatch repair protein MutS [Phycisphaerales bacterium]